MKSIDHDIAVRFTRWREAKGLSLAELGRRAKMTRQHAQNIEAGRSDISIAKLNSVCKRALKIDLATFFGPLPKGRAA